MTDRDTDDDRARTAPSRPVPPRPPVGTHLPPPAPRVTPPRPGVLRLSVLAWLGALAAGVVGLVAAARDVDGLRLALLDSAREQDPAASAALLDSSVRTVLWGLFAGTGALLVLCALSLASALRRRPKGRWVLLVAGLLALVAALVDQGLVAGRAEVDRGAFVVQAGLLAVAAVTLLVPASRAWFDLRRR